MREIIFRIRLKNRHDERNETIYAPLYKEDNGLMQFPVQLEEWEVLSIDEYTGLKDRNGKEIYEGDLLQISIIGFATGNIIAQQTTAVEYRDCKFGVVWSSGFTGLDGFSPAYTMFEVVGHIYEGENHAPGA